MVSILRKYLSRMTKHSNPRFNFRLIKVILGNNISQRLYEMPFSSCAGHYNYLNHKKTNNFPAKSKTWFSQSKEQLSCSQQ